MEENVALDSKKQRKFVKNIKSLKKLIKKRDPAPQDEVKEPTVPKPEAKTKKLRKRTPRGLVYLSHIPHGFYEHQMTEYFKQFGGVTNARVIRSKRTGRSKGFAFVEFRQPAVAEIVAETMNNYLMGKRLIKAVYIPPEKQKIHARRKFWSHAFNPSNLEKFKQKKAINSGKTDAEDLKKARKLLSNLEKTKKKLSDLGINYDFFTPVDIPEALVNVKAENDEVQTEEVKPTVDKNSKKKGKVTVDNKEQIVKKDGKQKQINNAQLDTANIEKKSKKNKKEKTQEVSKKEDNKNDAKLKKAGVKPLEDYIQVNNDSDDDDSSDGFDSDEYEKMMNNESDASSNDEEDDDDDDDDDGGEGEESDNEESVIDTPPKKEKKKSPNKGKPGPANNKNVTQVEQKKTSPQVKRKAIQVVPTTSKKPKFEKQSKPAPTKKQFKKRK